ncbi:MAG: kelch motif-containing protein [Schleiferiaceae bacterium]|nr:kelch motif-containing protein [Schleiferiaceae bacterium]
MKQVLFLLFFLFACSLTSVAQSVTIDSDGITKVAFSKGLSEIYVLYDNRLVTIDLAKSMSDDTIFNDNGIEMDEMVAISNRDESYFLSPSGGGVFLMKNHALIKIDNSFEHQMQTEAGVFIYKDHIYKYGGYGFWSDRHFITRFDFETNEWELVNFSKSETIPRGRRHSIVKVIGDDLYVIGGVMANELNPLLNESTDEVWKFDLVEGVWDYLGELNHSSAKLINFQITDFDDNILIINIYDDLLQVIDVVNNNIKSYSRTSFTRKLSGAAIPNAEGLFFYENHFYGFFKENASIDQMTLVRRSTDEIFGKLISDETLYTKETSLGSIIPTAMLLALLIPVGMLANKRKKQSGKLVLKKGQVYLNQKIIALEPLNLTVLIYLLDSTEQVYSKDLIALIDKPHLDYSHSTRIMNDVLYKTNYVLITALKTENDIIQINKSTFDKRLKVYSVDKDVFINF